MRLRKAAEKQGPVGLSPLFGRREESAAIEHRLLDDLGGVHERLRSEGFDRGANGRPLGASVRARPGIDELEMVDDDCSHF
jgi:hypothetical protein